MSLRNKTIILDPGHGGNSLGATFNDVCEKDIVLAVAKKVKTKLEAAGAHVVMTRTSDSTPWDNDYDINERVDYMNDAYRNCYDALVSIHVNSAVGNIGPYYQEGNSDALAKTIGFYYGKTLYKDDFAVLRDTLGSDIPKTLVEIERISSPWITSSSWQDASASNIYNGLRVFFNK
jgi:N-acetylmuramoyl-L-alanine amidase